jgi:hypothetical protein
LPRYRDATFFENGTDKRVNILADVHYVQAAIERFREIDPGFWTTFDLYVNFVLCPFSRYSRGGTDSDCIGALYLSRARDYSLRDLYEIIIHEFTHTVMFLDEHLIAHYGDEDAMAHQENWVRATISGTLRPLDKVLHSMVVATEILLHRDRVLGHDADTTIHQKTPELAESVRLTIASMLDHPNRDQILGPRGFQLIDLCQSAVAHL